MAGFLYFLAGWTNPVTNAVLDAHGLRYAFDRKPLAAVIQGRTPSGGPGTLLADQQRLEGAGSSFAYRGDAQRWELRPGAGSTQYSVPSNSPPSPHPPTPSPQSPVPSPPLPIYVGHWLSAVPSPTDLARRDQVPGERVRMADGRPWIVPRLLVFDALAGKFAYDLPSYVDCVDDGRGGTKLVSGEIVAEYQGVVKLAERVFAALKAPSGLESAAAIELACDVLAVNYTLSVFEACKFLRLFRDDDQLTRVAKVAAEWATFEMWLEKKTKDSSPPTSVT